MQLQISSLERDNCSVVLYALGGSVMDKGKMSRDSSFIIMGIIMVAVVIGTIMKKPVTVKFNLILGKIDASAVCSDIKQSIGAQKEDKLVIKNMDVNTSGQETPTNGAPAFNLTVSKDGIIKRIMWNMTFKDQYGTYNIFQASGGKQIRKGNEELVLTKTAKSEDIGNKNIMLQDVLEALKTIPWSEVKAKLPKSDFYMLRLEKFNPESSELKSKSIIFADKNGNISIISPQNISKMGSDILEFPVALSDDKGHGKESGFVILVKTK